MERTRNYHGQTDGQTGGQTKIIPIIHSQLRRRKLTKNKMESIKALIISRVYSRIRKPEGYFIE